MKLVRGKNRGFTLIEMMIVITIIGLIAVLGANIMSGTFRSKSRELQWRMASTIRYLYNSAVTESKTMRLVLDLQNGGSYWAESTTDKFLIERTADKKNSDEPKKEEAQEEKPSDTEKAEAAMTPEAKEALGLTAEGENAEQVEEAIEPAEAIFGTVEAPVLEIRQLPSGIQIKDVYTEHDGDTPVAEGKAYIYFFPNGYAEPSVINFKNADDTKQFSIRISPYNGEIDISPEYRKLEIVKK